MSHRTRCYPPDDAAFASYVALCEAALSSDLRDRPHRLQELIQRRFPWALVRRPVGFRPADAVPTWYIYRSGGRLNEDWPVVVS